MSQNHLHFSSHFSRSNTSDDAEAGVQKNEKKTEGDSDSILNEIRIIQDPKQCDVKKLNFKWQTKENKSGKIQTSPPTATMTSEIRKAAISGAVRAVVSEAAQAIIENV